MRFVIMSAVAFVLVGCGGAPPAGDPSPAPAPAPAAPSPSAEEPDVVAERTAEAVAAIEAVTEWNEHLADYAQRVYEYSVKPDSVLNLHTQETDKDEARAMANTYSVSIYSDLEWLRSVRVYGAGNLELVQVDVPDF